MYFDLKNVLLFLLDVHDAEQAYHIVYLSPRMSHIAQIHQDFVRLGIFLFGLYRSNIFKETTLNPFSVNHFLLLTLLLFAELSRSNKCGYIVVLGRAFICVAL